VDQVKRLFLLFMVHLEMLRVIFKQLIFLKKIIE